MNTNREEQYYDEYIPEDIESEDDDMDIDKCLNCGRYKAGHQLNKDQVCKIGCTNPNEY